MRFRSLIAIFLLVASAPSAFACPGHEITPQQLSRVLALASERVPEIARARAIADSANAELAVYGGLTRELQDFVCRKLDEKKTVAALETWLEKDAKIDFLDFHRAASDLDFLLVPREKPPYAGDRMSALNLTASKIREQFPGNAFYTKFDINVAPAFFAKYRPALDHFEPISNIPVGREGVMFLPELDVGDVNLARWGLESGAKGELDFALSGEARYDTAQKLKKVFRYLRYLSERKNWRVTPRADASIRAIVRELHNEHADRVRDLLQQGDKDMRMTRAGQELFPQNEADKLINDLEKLQIYSTDSLRTQKLLEEYGVNQLVKDAGLGDSRLLKPLGERPDYATPGKPLGKEVVVRHRTQLAVAQNLSEGALWISDNKSVIRGRTTTAVHGPGLYTALGSGLTEYGDFFVDITLSPEAQEGLDFERVNQDVYLLKTRRAIAKNPDGSLKITKPRRKELLEHLLERYLTPTPKGLDQAAYEKLHKENSSTLRALGSLLHPEENAADLPIFERLLEKAKERFREADLLQPFFSRGNAVNQIWAEGDPTAMKLKKILIKALNKGDIRYLPRQALRANPELMELYVRSRIQHYDPSPHAIGGYLSWEDHSAELLGNLRPFDSPADEALFREVIASAEGVRKKQGYLTGFDSMWRNYLGQPGLLSRIAEEKSPLAAYLREALEKLSSSWSVPKGEIEGSPALRKYVFDLAETGHQGAVWAIQGSDIKLSDDEKRRLLAMAEGPDERRAYSAYTMSWRGRRDEPFYHEILNAFLDRPAGDTQAAVVARLSPEELALEEKAFRQKVAAAFEANRDLIAKSHTDRMPQLMDALGSLIRQESADGIPARILAILPKLEEGRDAEELVDLVMKDCPDHPRCQKAVAKGAVHASWNADDVLKHLYGKTPAAPDVLDPILEAAANPEHNFGNILARNIHRLRLSEMQEQSLAKILGKSDGAARIAVGYFEQQAALHPSVREALLPFTKRYDYRGIAAASSYARGLLASGSNEEALRFTRDYFTNAKDTLFVDGTAWWKAVRSLESTDALTTEAKLAMASQVVNSWREEVIPYLKNLDFSPPAVQDTVVRMAKISGFRDAADFIQLDPDHERELAKLAFGKRPELGEDYEMFAGNYFENHPTKDPEILARMREHLKLDYTWSASTLKKLLKNADAAGAAPGCEAGFAKL